MKCLCLRKQHFLYIGIDSIQPLGVIMSVPATDKDSTAPNNLFDCTLCGTGSDKFKIYATNGDISLVEDLTTLAGNTDYVVKVTATDKDSLPHSNNIAVNATVTKVTATTTTTTTTTTTIGGRTVTTEGGGLLDSKIWLAITIVVLLCLLGGLAFLIYYCSTKKCAGYV